MIDICVREFTQASHGGKIARHLMIMMKPLNCTNINLFLNLSLYALGSPQHLRNWVLTIISTVDRS